MKDTKRKVKTLQTISSERNFDDHISSCRYGCQRKTKAHVTGYSVTFRMPSPLCPEGNGLFKAILYGKGMDRLTVELAKWDCSPL